jgi:CRISPR-associated protein Cas5t
MVMVLRVTMRAPIASFRRPLDHNYQRSLPLPPPTTLLGIAGAALGLSDRQMWADDSPLRQVLVTAWADAEPGRARDLWTVLKVKGGKIAERSPYFRELLFSVRYTLVYGGPEDILQQLREAFADPVYPLSLGREDELALVEDVTLEEATDGEPRFRGTIVPGDVRATSPRPVLQPGLRVEPVLVETLPLSFRLDNRGIRSPERMTPLSFLPVQVELDVPSPQFPVLQMQGRNFTWVNNP